MPKVLLVDGDIAFRRLASSTLEELGLEVVQAATAHEAALEFGCSDCDLIILDESIQDVNAVDWLSSLRRSGNQVDVIYVSDKCRSTRTYHKLLRELQVRLIVHRPISAPVFAQMVRQILKGIYTNNDQKKVTDQFLSEFTALAEGFAKRIPRLLEKLGEYIEQCRHGGNEAAEAYVRAMRLIQNLKHTGHSLDQRWIADSANDFESILNQYAQSDGSGIPAILNELHAQVFEATANAKVFASSTKACKPPATLLSSYQPISAKRVVLIDDDLFFIRRVEHLLAAEGYIVTTFNDTEKALELLDDVEPDLVILDVNLAEANKGHSVCRGLRATQRWAQLPVIMVSADAAQCTEAFLLSSGATDSAEKKARNSIILNCVRYNLSSRPTLPVLQAG